MRGTVECLQRQRPATVAAEAIAVDIECISLALRSECDDVHRGMDEEAIDVELLGGTARRR